MKTFNAFVTETVEQEILPKNTTVEKILKVAPWLSKAKFTNATIEIKSNKIIWKGGTWKGGVWQDGTWENGTWKKGTWKRGIWKGGTWKGGVWQDGTWKDKKNLRPDKR